MGGNSDDKSFLEACNDFLSGPFADTASDAAGYGAAGAIIAKTGHPSGWSQIAVAGAAAEQAFTVTDELVTEGIQSAAPDVCEFLNDTFVDDRTSPAESWDMGSNSSSSSSWGDSSSGGSDSSSSSGDA
jgi:hypothetical protein